MQKIVQGYRFSDSVQALRLILGFRSGAEINIRLSPNSIQGLLYIIHRHYGDAMATLWRHYGDTVSAETPEVYKL